MSKPKLREVRPILVSLRGVWPLTSLVTTLITPVTPKADSKVSLSLYRLHHRAQRGRKPLCTTFDPLSPLWVDLIA